ncbi:Rpn family recombination-promoting nuclease/putative transposase, partial [Prevotella sp.]
MAQFINPFSDWGFKHIFGREISKDLLICFLNDLFAGEFVIKSLAFGNKEQIGLSKDSREVIFDIYCTTDEGKEIIVEMQNRGQEHFIDRALYYTSRVIVNQGIKGEWDYDIRPVYTICFMNFVDPLLPLGKLRTDMILADKDNGKMVSDKIRMVYLMLPFFEKTETECENDFERWIFVLKNMNTFERMPFLAKNAVFKKLAEISDLRTLSKKDMDKYEDSIRIMRDAYAT